MKNFRSELFDVDLAVEMRTNKWRFFREFVFIANLTPHLSKGGNKNGASECILYADDTTAKGELRSRGSREKH